MRWNAKRDYLALAAAATLFLLACLAGCCTPQSVKDDVRKSAATSTRFVELMDAGETTREQEQDMLRAQAKTFQALDEGMNE